MFRNAFCRDSSSSGSESLWNAQRELSMRFLTRSPNAAHEIWFQQTRRSRTTQRSCWRCVWAEWRHLLLAGYRTASHIQADPFWGSRAVWRFLARPFLGNAVPFQNQFLKQALIILY